MNKPVKVEGGKNPIIKIAPTITQERKEKLLIERVITELRALPIECGNWGYASTILYCIGLLEGFKDTKYKE
jgi:hypothetical protein